MASQGGELDVSVYTGKKKRCQHEKPGGKCRKLARFHIVCSPQYFMIVILDLCEEHKNYCVDCTAKNKPIKSALD